MNCNYITATRAQSGRATTTSPAPIPLCQRGLLTPPLPIFILLALSKILKRNVRSVSKTVTGKVVILSLAWNRYSEQNSQSDYSICQ